jgi:GDP-D-mannose dehydratase
VKKLEDQMDKVITELRKLGSMKLLRKENINEDDSIVTSSDEVRPFDIPIFIMDSTKAESRWGFKNTYTMDEILAEIRDYAINDPEFLDYLYS